MQGDLSDAEDEFIDDEFTFFDDDLEEDEEVAPIEYERAVFEWPDYCVCVRPTKKQMRRACKREEKVMRGIDPDAEEEEEDAELSFAPEESEEVDTEVENEEESGSNSGSGGSPYRPYDFCYDIWEKFGTAPIEDEDGKIITDEEDAKNVGSLEPMFVKPEGFDTVINDKGKEKKRKKTKKYTSNAKLDALAQYELDFEDWKARKEEVGAKEAGKKPKKVSMAVNGYWNRKGMCTCYKPTTLPLPLIITF